MGQTFFVSRLLPRSEMDPLEARAEGYFLLKCLFSLLTYYSGRESGTGMALIMISITVNVIIYCYYPAAPTLPQSLTLGNFTLQITMGCIHIHIEEAGTSQ